MLNILLQLKNNPNRYKFSRQKNIEKTEDFRNLCIII